MTIEIWDLAAADERVRFSPFCWRIHFALAHKGLASRSHAWRFTDKDKIAFSDQGFVPVIRDGPTIVSDSWTIAEYLDEAYPARPLLIDGPQAKALTSFVRQWAQVTLSPLIMRTIMPDLFAVIAEKDKAYFRESREKRLGKTLEEVASPLEVTRAEMKTALHPMRLTLAGQPFLCGEAPAFADYIVMGAFMWARCVSKLDLLEADDPVHAWRERMLDLYDGLGRHAPRA
jgi:glutathione S-transferase